VQKQSSTPSIVPDTEEQTVYLVVDDFGHFGRAWRETDVEATDLETVITDMLDARYNGPVRVVGFNTAEGWARDVSHDIAGEIRRRCDLQMIEIPANLKAFVRRHETATGEQLSTRTTLPPMV